MCDLRRRHTDGRVNGIIVTMNQRLQAVNVTRSPHQTVQLQQPLFAQTGTDRCISCLLHQLMSLTALQDYIDAKWEILSKMSWKRRLLSAIQRTSMQDLYTALKEKDVDLTVTFANGGTLLHCAIENTFIEGVRVFMELGIDINQKNTFGISPLMLAVSHGAHQSFDWLIGHPECDVNAIDNHSGMTALHRAADNGCEHCTSELLRHGAFPDVIDEDDATPILLAFNSNHVTASKLLIRYGCDVTDDRLLPLILERKQMKLIELYFTCVTDFTNVNKTLQKISRNRSNCDADFLDVCRTTFFRPKCLKELCRLRVRLILGWPYLSKLQQLAKHIPSALLLYLQFPELAVENPSKSHRNCVMVA